MASQPTTFTVLRRHDFRLLWISQLISAIGSAFTTLAASLLVYRLTGSAFHVGLLLLTSALPALLIGPLAGVCVDRFDRRRIMIAADLLRALLLALLPLGLHWGLWWLYAVLIAANLARQFFDPAYASLLPESAADDELTAANALQVLSTYGTPALGYALAGLIITHWPIGLAFGVDALSFLVSALCLWQIASKPQSSAVGEPLTVRTFLADLRAGLQFVQQTALLRSLFLLYIPVCLAFGLINALALPFALRALHASEFDYSLLEGFFSVGFLVGSLGMARIGERLTPTHWLVAGLIGLGLCNMAYAFSPSVFVGLLLCLLYGAINAPLVIARQLLMQRATPSGLRGRVNSAWFIVTDTLCLVGMAGGGLADWWDVQLLYFVSGGLVVLACGICAPWLPGFWPAVSSWRRLIARARLNYVWGRVSVIEARPGE